MALSSKTLTAATRILVKEKDDTYPDRQATPTSAGVFPLASPNATHLRLPPDEIPSTTDDMSAAFKWQHGEEIYGTHAKDNKALEEYRRDINRGYNNEDMEDAYVDTFKPIGPQLYNLKGRSRRRSRR